MLHVPTHNPSSPSFFKPNLFHVVASVNLTKCIRTDVLCKGTAAEWTGFGTRRTKHTATWNKVKKYSTYFKSVCQKYPTPPRPLIFHPLRFFIFSFSTLRRNFNNAAADRINALNIKSLILMVL